MENYLPNKKNDDVFIVVILVNFNGFDDTIECIKSLRKVPEKIEIIVVDNASSENERLFELGSLENVLVLNQETNLGFGRANNVGIDWAVSNLQFSHILLLNNDTYVKEDFLSKLLPSFNCNSNVGIVSPKILLEEDNNYLWYGGGFVNWYKGSVAIPGYGFLQDRIAQEKEVDFASGCAMLFSRESILNIGGFDPRFFMYEEDLELCLRAKKKGWTIVYNPQSVIFHKGQGSQRNKNEKFLTLYDPNNPRLAFLLYHVTKNKLHTISKHASKLEFMKFSIGYPLFLTKKIFKYALFRRWDAIGAIKFGIRDYFRERDNEIKEVKF